MLYRITNTSFDRSKAHLHRHAARFEPVPSIAGTRLRPGEHKDVDEATMKRLEPSLKLLFKQGAIDIKPVDLGFESLKKTEPVVAAPVEVPPEPKKEEAAPIPPPPVVEPPVEAPKSEPEPLPPAPTSTEPEHKGKSKKRW